MKRRKYSFGSRKELKDCHLLHCTFPWTTRNCSLRAKNKGGYRRPNPKSYFSRKRVHSAFYFPWIYSLQWTFLSLNHRKFTQLRSSVPDGREVTQRMWTSQSLTRTPLSSVDCNNQLSSYYSASHVFTSYSDNHCTRMPWMTKGEQTVSRSSTRHYDFAEKYQMTPSQWSSLSTAYNNFWIVCLGQKNLERLGFEPEGWLM